MVYDFHTQTFLSDAALSPVELVRRAIIRGYKAIALTDHVGSGNCELVLKQLIQDCTICMRHWDIIAIPGVELTHVPAAAIAEVAHLAKGVGALIVVVHGETIVEPVEPGTNLAAVQCSGVDILAHPGFITAEEAQLAAGNGIFLEISARKGHSLTNGHVVKVARAAGAKLLVNSDAHDPDDLLTPAFARSVASGAGLLPEELDEVLLKNPTRLLSKIGLSRRVT
ncbi:MAG: histidinol phosphate phosphatase domain-containing protein [Chloroflexi bacterium]|nr:histidinol phosphate phosphatase domain-containing protein [Chloroflexota bacterium]MCL5076075.1 histidinol phosphate phosphatase domain-containing protein [Chloroflexota bacterium]